MENVAKEVKKVTIVHHGMVTGCKYLRLRKQASLESEVLEVLKEGSEVVVNKRASTKEFYKVSFGNLVGYCLRTFITITGVEQLE